ncbi:MAG: nucleotidyltransferase family protein [Cyanobacteria bacterium J06635_1]
MKTLSNPTRLPGELNQTTRAEVELLLCCARTQIEPERVERIQALLALELDWESLITLATRHRVLPLLFHNLQQVAPRTLPLKELTHLQIFFSHHTFRNLNQTAEIIRLVDLLAQNNIQAIPFKGPALTLNVYGDIALRQFDDLDILVPQSDFFEARALLMTQGGYQRPKPSNFLTLEQELSHLRSGYACSLVNLDRKTFVDLHQQLTGGTFLPYPFDFQELHQRLVPVSQTPQLLTLHPEDLLLYLCVHGAKSLWERLGWICDVAELVRAYPTIDWEQLLKKAQTAKIERMLLLGLHLANQVLGMPLPAEIRAQINADLEAKRLAKQVSQRLLSGEGGLNANFHLDKLKFQFRAIADPREQVRYCIKCFYRHGLTPIWRVFRPTEKEWQFIKLPRSFHFLYYLIRPMRLLGREAANVWKNFSSQSSEQM